MKNYLEKYKISFRALAFEKEKNILWGIWEFSSQSILMY